MCRKDKSVTKISIFFSKDEVLFFPRRKWSYIVNLPPGHCDIWGSASDSAVGTSDTQQDLWPGQPWEWNSMLLNINLQVLTVHSVPWLQPTNQRTIVHLPVSSSKQTI